MCHDVRSMPARTAAWIPAAASFSAASGASDITIAELPGSRPSPARKRLARPTSWSLIAPTPSRSIVASVGAVATHMYQAGDVSSLRALAASRRGAPKYVVYGSSPAYHPAVV